MDKLSRFDFFVGTSFFIMSWLTANEASSGLVPSSFGLSSERFEPIGRFVLELPTRGFEVMFLLRFAGALVSGFAFDLVKRLFRIEIRISSLL